METLIKKYVPKGTPVYNIYGVIYYRPRHSYIASVLNNPQFWKGFDDQTINFPDDINTLTEFVLFTIKYDPNQPARPRSGHNNIPADAFKMMVEVNSYDYEKELLEKLYIRNKDKPYFILFAEVLDKEGNISKKYQLSFKLNDRSEADARNSIYDMLNTVMSVLKYVDINNYKNARGLFAALGQKLQDDANRKKCIKITKFLWQMYKNFWPSP